VPGVVGTLLRKLPVASSIRFLPFERLSGWLDPWEGRQAHMNGVRFQEAETWP